MDESLLDQEEEDDRPTARTEGGQVIGDRPHRASEQSLTGSETDRYSAIYRVIRSNRLENLVYRNADGERAQVQEFGSFESGDSGPAERVHLRHVHERNRNISTSFNPSTMTCYCKGGEGHRVLPRSGSKPENHLSPPVFVLADQHFPASVLSGDDPEQECLKIVRVENGTLHEMMSVFLDLVQGSFVPMGTVVLVAGLAHLGHVGLSAYAEDLHSVSKRMYDRFGSGVKLLHGTAVPCAAMEDVTIRAWYDLDQWLRLSSAQHRLGVTATELLNLLMCKEEGGSEFTQIPYKVRHRLPSAVARPETTIWEMSGSQRLLKSKDAFGQKEVATILEVLIRELNKRFHVNLGHGGGQPMLPDDSVSCEDQKLRVIMVGGSHAKRIAQVMESMEAVKVIDLSRPGLILTEEVAARLTSQVMDAAQQEFDGDTLIVYNVFDNVSYQQGSEGNWSRLEKGEDGRYHAKGMIQVAQVEDIKYLFKSATVLFRAGGHHKKVIIPPMERYIGGTCCGDMRHMTNYSTGFVVHAASRLTAIRRAIGDHVHSRRLPNYRVISSYSLLGMREDGSDELLRAVWAEDPVHLSSAGYAIMAESLVDLLVEETNTFCNVPKTRDQPTEDMRRSAWISNENVGEAGPSRKRGRWSGGSKGWGGGRGWGGRGGGGDRRKW